MTASIGGAEVGSIGMDVEDHVNVGGAVANFGIRMRGHVVEELVDTFACLFSGGLSWAAMAESAMRMVGSTARAY